MQCPSGKECDRTLDTLANCATGSYSIGGVNDNCVVCPIGSFCPFPSVGPINCPAGTHTGGSTSQTSCTDCPAGSYCTSTRWDCDHSIYLSDQMHSRNYSDYHT